MPSEIVELLNACSTIEAKLNMSLQPEHFLKSVIITKKDVKDYETFIMDNLRKWFNNGELNPSQIKRIFSTLNDSAEKAFERLNAHMERSSSADEWMLNNVFELARELQNSKLLPAIFFCNSSKMCNKLAMKLNDEFEKLEDEDKKLQKTKKEIKKIKKFINEIKDLQDQNIDCSSSVCEEIGSKIIDLDRIDDKYTFLDPKFKQTSSEIDEEMSLHKNKKRQSKLKPFFKAWKRGIGVHHAEFHTKFRASTEYLFRKRHLQIVFATETLSLGIDVPCRTVVLPKDSIFFGPTYYKQMVGRAGRRGFDKAGNIVYYGIPMRNVKNFISSNVPNIKGCFSFNLNLILQVSVMHTYNKNAMKALKSFVENTILSINSTDYTSLDFKQLLVIQINFLIHKRLLDQSFSPSECPNFILSLRNEKMLCNLISDLLRSDFFERLADRNQNDVRQLVKDIVFVLCHFVHVRYVTQSQSCCLERFQVPILIEFLNKEKQQLLDFLSTSTTNQNVNALILNAFPSYDETINFRKNSYIYDFYLNKSIEKINDVNRINETKLWYALKSFRVLLRSINKNGSLLLRTPILKEAFSKCEAEITECFFLVTN